jgi:hypothetical protein
MFVQGGEEEMIQIKGESCIVFALMRGTAKGGGELSSAARQGGLMDWTNGRGPREMNQQHPRR